MHLGTLNTKCTNAKTGSGWAKSKKVVSIMVVNYMLKMYYFVNNVRACITQINSLINLYWEGAASANPIPQALLRKADVVTFKFLSGRAYVLTDKYQEARDALLYALEHCHKDAHENRRRILDLLIPVQLYFGE
jgi:hypothetical protein